jgi:hypothetical protein
MRTPEEINAEIDDLKVRMKSANIAILRLSEKKKRTRKKKHD